MKPTGHKTRSAFERYSIVSDSDLQAAAWKIDRDSFGTVDTATPAAADPIS